VGRNFVHRLEADDAQVEEFLAFGVEKDDAGRAEQAEALQQRLVGIAVGGDVGLQQHASASCARRPWGRRR
jgi:hypothetical protein